MLEKSYKLNSPSCIAEAVDGDLIVINLASGRYYNMHHETVFAWNALTSGISPSDLILGNTWNNAQQLNFQKYVQFLLNEQLIVALSGQTLGLKAPEILINEVGESFYVDVFTDMEEMLKLDPIHDANADTGWPNKT
jgi:hypothetical protein